MVDYWENIEVYDIKVGIYSNLDIHVPEVKVILLPLSQGHSDFTISNSFCPAANGQNEVKLRIEPSLDIGTQIYQNSWSHDKNAHHA